MSREFGSYRSAYLHDQMGIAADDCRGGDQEFTRLWAAVFDSLHRIMWDVCNAEAGDSNAAAPIIAAIGELPALKAHLAVIDGYLDTYRAVAKEAVRSELSKHPKPKVTP